MLQLLAIGALPLPLLLAQQPWPVDPEQIREHYGQSALFRFDLGVDGAQLTCPAAVERWSGSRQEQRLNQLMKTGDFYGAGQQLGSWIRQQHCN